MKRSAICGHNLNILIEAAVYVSYEVKELWKDSLIYRTFLQIKLLKRQVC